VTVVTATFDTDFISPLDLFFFRSDFGFLVRYSDDYSNVNAVGPAAWLAGADFPLPHLTAVHGHF
jgi:hypothetical protein